MLFVDTPAGLRYPVPADGEDEMTIDTAIAELAHVLGDRLSRSKSDLDAHGTSETHFAPAPPDAPTKPG